MAITLADVNSTFLKQGTEQNKKLDQISSNLSTFLEVMKSDKLKGTEEAIEGGAQKSNRGPQDTGFDLPTAGLFAGIGAAIAALTGTIGTIIAGFTGAILASVDETMNDISRTFAAAWLGVGDKLKSFFKMFATEGVIGAAIARLITSLKGPASVFDEAAGRFRNIETGRFMKSPGIISKAITKVSDAFDSVGNTLSKYFGEGTKFGKAVAFLKETFTFAEDSKVLKLLKGFGTVLKKIFLPIGLIFTAYDTIKGAIEGYGENGFVGALTGAVTGLLASIVGAPLNLIKEIGLWVAKQFGLSDEDADKISAAMDFEKIIKDFGKAIANLINKAVDWVTHFDIGEAVGKAWDAITGTDPDLTPSQQAQQELSRIPGMQKIIEEQGVDKARELVEEDYSGRKQEKILSLLDRLEEAPQLSEGTKGLTGKLFGNFGKGTLSILHGNEAVVPENSPEGELLKSANTYNFNKKKPTQSPPEEVKSKKISTQPMPEGMGSFLGKIMNATAPVAKFANQKGTELKAKEEAMRAAGASDMDIAKSMMGDMGGIMSGLQGAVSAGGFNKLQVPKIDTSGVKNTFEPNNTGNIFSSIVRESQENKEKRATQSSPAPVIISDNSSKSSSTSNTAMPIISKPYDFDDPFVSGLSRV